MPPKAASSSGADAANKARTLAEEQRQLAQDLREGKFRTVVVPAAFSLEEYALGCVTFPVHRLKTIKLSPHEVRPAIQQLRSCRKHQHSCSA